MRENDEMKAAKQIAYACADACLAGGNVTVSMRGVPPGFPRGELLSVGTDGSANYSVNPVKVLGWIHRMSSAGPNAGNNRHP